MLSTRELTPYEQAILDLYNCQTMDEVFEARHRLRPFCLGNPLREAMWGYRRPRKIRAEVDKALRRPTRVEVAAAKQMLDAGVPEHEIEQCFNAGGVQMTRNRLSRLLGARP